MVMTELQLVVRNVAANLLTLKAALPEKVQDLREAVRQVHVLQSEVHQRGIGL